MLRNMVIVGLAFGFQALIVHNAMSQEYVAVPTSRPVETDAKQMIDALTAADLTRIAKLLDQGVDPNINLGEKDTTTPLIYAVATNNEELLKLLLARGAKVNQANSTDTTPLHAAALTGHPRIIALLCEHGASIDAKAPGLGGITPLQMAILQNQIGATDMLLRLGANVNITDPNGMTALHYAAKYASPGIAKSLIEFGADRNRKDVNGLAPIEVARRAGKDDVVAAIQSAPTSRPAMEAVK